MKYLGILCLFLFSTQLTFGQAHAGEYMDLIGEQYKNIQKEMWEYTSAASHGKNANKVEKLRMALIETTYKAKGNVKMMKSWEGNTAYRDSVVSFLNIYYLVLKEDYAKIVNMEEIAEKSYDAMEAYMMAKEEANNKLGDASKMLGEVQDAFAKEFNVELSKASDELTQKMEVANEVYDYYNVLYLIFFKSYVQDLYLADAIAKGDVSAIEQNKSALEANAAEGLEKIKTLSPFKGDNSLIKAGSNLLEFYQDITANQIPHITDYFIKTENFETIRKSFEQKKEKDRTQEDIDQYNNAVKESNAAGTKYNEANQYMFQFRQAKIQDWNNAVENFLDKHVPK
ncbi:hypothetical protein K6119_14515 [Paracrocinitomix mangrovi]|uniref:LIC11966 family surface protein n=1 Tax=Paracrocinitomix mangrovi TaxID=2862509 RepID=UPI001C8EA25A|nr:hypothetical protein [Paracrocinitomix mangrovi]UKN00945.1 hypothetical protein K6119_14515 [Paracrocinitomix mangrovi]